MEHRPSRLCPALVALLAWAGGCASEPNAPTEPARAPQVEPIEPDLALNHRGPSVAPGKTGPARFVEPVLASFDASRAMSLAEAIDRWYRAPANRGYRDSLDQVERALREAGFGSRAGLEIERLSAPLQATTWGESGRAAARAWNPIAGSLELRGGGQSLTLHSFADSSGRDRTLLPVHTLACDVEGEIALSLDQCAPGKILVTHTPPKADVLSRAQAAGAAAVLSCNLESYNSDPSGRARHQDAIQFRTLPHGTPIPVGMISPRSAQTIEATLARDPQARLRYVAQVEWEDQPLETLCARIVGRDRPDEAIAIASHVQEPGACDNASGVAGLAETARVLAELIQSGRLERPSRTLVFLWGDEFRQSETWLAQTSLRPVAALSSDMTGESLEETGAMPLFERMPDPGALTALAPDEHTEWGAKSVDPTTFLPNGLAVIARTAMADVGAQVGEWRTADHPFEGGSDHEVFIDRKIPAGLFWHFTDFAYHTSLDRMEHVDGEELRRMSTAIAATALAIADPEPDDLLRYLACLDREAQVRMEAAREAGEAELEQRWHDWCFGARQWLRVECLRIPPEQR